MLGSLAKAILCAALGQTANDVVYSNSRLQEVKPSFPDSVRAEIRELFLYASLDQGETWQQVSKSLPDQAQFQFKLPVDGTYWLRVATITRDGRQEPENLFKAKPNWRLVVDTLRPLIRINSAVRSGNKVAVNWEIREDHPEWSTFSLQYFTSPNGLATPVNANPGLTGAAEFNPATNGPITVRLTLRDKAGNESTTTAEVAGRDAGRDPTLDVPPPQLVQGNLTLPPPPQLLQGTPPATSSATTQITPPPVAQGGQVNFPAPQPSEFSSAQAPPTLPTATPTTPIEPLLPQTAETVGAAIPGNPTAKTYPPGENLRTFSPTPAALQPVGGSRWMPNASANYQPPMERVEAPIASTAYQVQQVQYQAPIAPTPPLTPRKLPDLKYVKSPEVVLEYELSKIGPSGIGSVDIYLTRDDGQNWEFLANDPAVVGNRVGGLQQGIVDLPGDGIYGFSLVVKSQAQVRQELTSIEKKNKGPRPGDAPDIRVEVDTQAPTAELFPPRRDPAKANSLLLIWNAEDKNLGPNPITLEWAEKREGPWHAIAANLPNTKKHSWQLPPQLPVAVYLRIRAKDVVGNEGVAVTPDPQLVDLFEPEGRLVEVGVVPRR